jgi:hypothetical protein
MMKSKALVIVMVLTMVAMWGVLDVRAEHRIGGGANYWVALDDIEIDDIDDNGLSYFGSYQYRKGFVGIDLQIEVLPDFYGEDAYMPQAYVLLGGTIYAAAGVGIVNYDGEWADDPFYALKAGLDLALLPGLHLDIFGNYRFGGERDLDDAIDDIDTDTIFLGAAIRFGSN